MRWNLSAFILIVILPSSPLEAMGLTQAMGGLLSVIPDGPFDAERNPALLSQQDKIAGAGIRMTYQLKEYEKSDINFSITSPIIIVTNSDFLFYDPDIFFLQGEAALYHRRENLSWALMVSQSRNTRDEYSIMSITALPGPVNNKGYTEKETLERKSRGSGVIAYTLLPGLSIGAQIQVKYDYERESEITKNYEATILTSRKWKEARKDSCDLSFVSGLYYVSGVNQIGLILSSGDYSFQKKRYSERNSDLTTPANNYDIEASIGWEGQFTGGTAALIGGGIALTGRIIIAGEAGLLFPFKYAEPVLMVDGPDYIETDVENKAGIGYIFSSGIKIDATDGVAFACGVLFRRLSIESESGASSSEYSINQFGFRGGIERRISYGGYVALIVSIEYLIFDASMSDQATTMNFDFQVDRSILLMTAGISYIHLF